MDLNVRAFREVQASTFRAYCARQSKGSARKGGLAGGVSRANSIGAERRTEFPKKLVQQRVSESPTQTPLLNLL
jgi:hypothetical protein